MPKRYGEQHPSAKLSDEQVIEIRQLYRTGKYTYKQLAKRFEVSSAQIISIIRWKKWIHLYQDQDDYYA